MNQIIIDVREPEEFRMGHVNGALNIPPAKLISGEPAELQNLPRDAQLIVYCRSGSRSNASIPFLKQFGFINIQNGINKDHVQASYGANGINNG